MFEDVFDEEMARESVFRDASKLSPDYVPRSLVHREEEFRQLTRVFKQVVENRMSQRVLITGSVGVGKTALARRFGGELEQHAKGKGVNLTYLHVNCRKDKTPYSVLAKILQHYNPRWPYHGLGPEKLLDTVVTHLNSKDAYLTLTLDELDYFVQVNGPDLLYSLTRLAEESGGPNRVSIMAIARDKSFLRLVDAATQSTFMHNVIPLNVYTAQQLRDILSSRVGEAFKAGAVEDETIELIAEIASRWGDARFALELLWRAGMMADGERKDEVTAEHVRQAKAEVHSEVKKEALRELGTHEKLALLSVARKLAVSKRAHASLEEVEGVYRLVCEEYKEEPREHTQFWEYVKHLEGLGILDIQFTRGKPRGRFLKISVQDVPVAWLEKELESILEGRKSRPNPHSKLFT